MKKGKKILSVLLSVLMAFACVACTAENSSSSGNSVNNSASDGNGNGNGNGGGVVGGVQNSTSNDVTNIESVGSQAHYATNTLHKVSVTASNRPFIANGLTAYKIVVADNERAEKAASFLAAQLYEATGVLMPVVSASSVTYDKATSKYIVIGAADLFAQAGLTMPSDNLGNTGYYIKSVNDSVFMAVKHVLGYQQAVLAFLRNVMGYEIYGADTILYTKDGTTLPDMEIIERPDFEYHRPGNVMSAEGRYAMGFNETSDIYIDVGSTWHNTMYYLPRATYEKTHPKWYSDRKTTDPEGMQICATAHGDAAELQAMTETVAEIVYQKLEEYPERNTITFTTMDNLYVCSCEGCIAEKQKYGTDTAAYLKLTNNISKLVDKKYADQGKTREYTLMMFAYQITEQAPVKKEDGKWVPIDDDMKLADNVGVYIAPTSVNYTYSFYEEVNKTPVEKVDGWCALTDNIYMWLYQTNFAWYMMPHNTFEAAIETYRYCQSVNTIQLNNLGQYFGMENPTGFSRLKDYIDAQAMFNVNVNYNELLDKWFAAYFREAAAPMRTYYDELVAYLNMLCEEYPDEVNGNMSCNIHQAKFWEKARLESWMQRINEAYANIAKYQTLNPKLYEVLKKHITTESLFLRYSLLEFYAGTYNAEDLYNARISFRDDIRLLNNLYAWEWNGFKGNKYYEFESLFREWGVS